MKVKTCEEYVINRLEETENKLAVCENDLANTLSALDRANGIITEMLELVQNGITVQKIKNSNNYYLNADVWSSYDRDRFEQFVETFNLELPEDEDDG